MVKKETHQENLFDRQPPVIPDFDDFEKEMDFIASLPNEDWYRLLGGESSKGKKLQGRR